MKPADYDAIVIGAGPAGLTAAVYLARFRRRVLVLSQGPPRASWIPESHNTPGFSQGVGGLELLSRLTEQATRFGAELRAACVTGLSPDGGGFEVCAEAEVLRAPHVILATRDALLIEQRRIREERAALAELERKILPREFRHCRA